jgi:hypothetical protein
VGAERDRTTPAFPWKFDRYEFPPGVPFLSDWSAEDEKDKFGSTKQVVHEIRGTNFESNWKPQQLQALRWR